MAKGKTNNPNGRPKGAKDKVSSDIKKRMAVFLDGKFDQFTKDMNDVEDPGYRAKLYMEAYKLVVPKPRDIEDIEDERDFRKQFMDRIFNRD